MTRGPRFRLRALFLTGCSAMVLVAAGALLTGCEETPLEGYDAFLQAAEAKDADAAWARFSTPTQRMMEDVLARFHASDVGSPLAAKDQLFTAGLIDVRGIEYMTEISRDGDNARIEVVDFDGEKQRIEMRREQGTWRIHDPGSTATAAATR